MTSAAASLFAQTYFHGPKATLAIADLFEAGTASNYGQRSKAKYIYLTATLDAAIWGAELAVGDGCERIYLVEPTGVIEDDPNLTDKNFRATRQNHTGLPMPLKLLVKWLHGKVTHRNNLKR